MRKAISQTAPWLMFLVPLLFVGCTPAHGAGDYKTVRAYDKVTGEYFDVKVPYETHLGHGRLSRDEPSRATVEGAVDKATWSHESSASMDNYLHGLPYGGGRAGSGNSNGMPGSTPTNSGPSPFDHSTLQGSSYHDANGSFSR
jgi:hypothetical protein